MRRGFGGFRRGGFGYRGFGYPMFPMRMGGSSLLTGLMAGGLGYLLGSSTANQQMPYQQTAPTPNYQQPQAAPSNSSQDNSMLSQLKMLSDLHNSGALTDDEFIKAKNRLFGS